VSPTGTVLSPIAETPFKQLLTMTIGSVGLPTLVQDDILVPSRAIRGVVVYGLRGVLPIIPTGLPKPLPVRLRSTLFHHLQSAVRSRDVIVSPRAIVMVVDELPCYGATGGYETLKVLMQ
jgi:hypothetical protein